MIFGYILLSLDILAAMAVTASFPVLFLTEYARLAYTLFSTGMVVHFITHYWWPIPIVTQDDDSDDFSDDIM